MPTGSKFKVGQIVYLRADRRRDVRDPYQITRVLPIEGGEQQYRIKSTLEPHERVVPERELEGEASAENGSRPAEPRPDRPRGADRPPPGGRGRSWPGRGGGGPRR
jgi:hypothetical protein